jgi:hypothetical protein
MRADEYNGANLTRGKKKMGLVSRAASTFAFVALLLGGCATTLHEGPKFTAAPPPKADEALIYLYRGDVPPYYLSPTIQLDSVKVVDLPNRGYTHLYAKPGKYRFKSQWSPIAAQPTLEGPFEFAAGHTYFIRLGGNIKFGQKHGPNHQPQKVIVSRQSVETVLPEEGMSEISDLMYIRPEVERLR